MIFALCPIVQMSLHLLGYFFSFVFEGMDHSRKYFYFTVTFAKLAQLDYVVVMGEHKGHKTLFCPSNY